MLDQWNRMMQGSYYLKSSRGYLSADRKKWVSQDQAGVFSCEDARHMVNAGIGWAIIVK